MCGLEPTRKVPKKYWKYADLFPDYQLYKVRKEKLGAIVRCFECKRDIPSLEEFAQLLFREPNTQWSGRKAIAICALCVKAL